MTATRDRRGDPHTTDEATPLAWDQRSVIRSRRGLPWWGATLLCLGLTAAGAFGEQALAGELGLALQVCFAVGAVAAVLGVRRRAVFGQMVQPPLVMAAVVPTVVLTGSGIPEGSDMLSKALAVGTPLIDSFPVMAIVTAVAVVLGIVRYKRERAPADSRGSRPRAGEEGEDRARRDRPPRGEPGDEERRPRRPGPPPPTAQEPDQRPGAAGERPDPSRAPARDSPARGEPTRDVPAREQGGRPPRRRPPRPPEGDRPRPDVGGPAPNAPRRTPPKGEEPPPRPRKSGGPQGGNRPGRDEHPPQRHPPGPGRPGTGRPPRNDGPEGRR